MAPSGDAAESAGAWEPVPPGHPDRAAFEQRMRELGIRPAATWEPRSDRKVFRRPGWRDWLRSRLTCRTRLGE
jgi:hypothetical protein